jgi:hypothetical protein
MSVGGYATPLTVHFLGSDFLYAAGSTVTVLKVLSVDIHSQILWPVVLLIWKVILSVL